MQKIFISYSSNDSVFADLVKERLERNGNVEVWLDHYNLGGGDNWRDAIDKGISNSDLLILIITPDSSNSYYVTYEWAYALGKGKKVIPLLFKDSDRHPRLDVIQYLDFRDPRNNGQWDKLKGIINSSDTSIGSFQVAIDEVKTPSLLTFEEREIKKVKDRVPGWFKNPRQVNSQILHNFLNINPTKSSISIKELAQSCKQIEKFSNNFSNMCNISSQGHGKVFERTSEEVRLWPLVADFVLAEYYKANNNI